MKKAIVLFFAQLVLADVALATSVAVWEPQDTFSLYVSAWLVMVFAMLVFVHFVRKINAAPGTVHGAIFAIFALAFVIAFSAAAYAGAAIASVTLFIALVIALVTATSVVISKKLSYPDLGAYALAMAASMTAFLFA